MTTAGWAMLLGALVLLTAGTAETLYLSVRFDQLAEAVKQVLGKENDIMAQVQVAQEDLDALAAELGTIADDLAAEIAALEAEVAAGNLPAGSLDGLTAVKDRLAALETPPTT